MLEQIKFDPGTEKVYLLSKPYWPFQEKLKDHVAHVSDILAVHPVFIH